MKASGILVLASRDRRSIAILVAALVMAAVTVFALISHDDTPSPGEKPPGVRTDTPDQPPPGVAFPTRPRSIDDMAQSSSVVVEATVKDVRKGPDLAGPGTSKGPPRLEGSPDPPTVGTERVVMTTDELLKGSIPRTFIVYTLKFPENNVPAEAEVFAPYAVDQRYVLFLDRHVPNDGTYVPQSADARIKIGKDGAAQPLVAGPVANQVKGENVKGIKDEIAR
jgi:hypothetical protein